MKIAILTQPLRANYGGVLQNYAMQQVLMRLGHSPITLEKDPFQNISKLKLYLELPKRFITKYILKKRKYILSEQNHNNYIEQVSNVLKPFIEKYINRCFVQCYEAIECNKYDTFLVGSDQVWRPLYNCNVLDKMFLSFIPESSNIKRIAYAASFGTSEWEYDEVLTTQCANLIQRFDAVSTREIDGVDLCNKYLKYENVVPVLDPTLLLDKEEYLTLCKDIPTCRENLLFAYILDTNPETLSKLNDIANAKGLKLKLVYADENCTLSVEEWIAMFRDAKMVITDSFHGTVFSIIFNKEFYTIANHSRGGSRFSSILSLFNLQDRLFNDVKSINLSTNQIAWNIIEYTKFILQNKSIKFLLNNLNSNA